MKTLKSFQEQILSVLQEDFCKNLVQAAVMYAVGKELTIVVLP